MSWRVDSIVRAFHRARWFVVAVVAFVVAAVAAIPALASSGGQEPSSAPGLALGSHAFSSCEGIDQEFWSLPLLNFDRVVIDLNGSNYIYTSGTGFLGPSVNDYNWKDQNFLNDEETSGGDKRAYTFTASQGTGRYLFYVGCGDGPYDFLVASIQHTVRIDLVPRPVVLPVRGTMTANVIGGDGNGLSGGVQVVAYASYGGSTHALGSGVPAGGRVSIAYALPTSLRRRRVVIWLGSAETSSYLAAVTSKLSVPVR